LPFVVLFGEYRSDEADECCVVGEDTDDIGAPADFLVESFPGYLEFFCFPGL
jgi:hypothetical protein